MNQSTLLRIALALFLAMAITPFSRGATTGNYAYEMISVPETVNGTYTLSGWDVAQDGMYRVYTTTLTPSNDDRMLQVWGFSSDSSSPYAKLKSVKVRKTGQTEWLTMSQTSCTIIPAGYDEVQFTSSSNFNFVTVGPIPDILNITLEPEYKVLTGTIDENGTIKAEGTKEQVIEIEITAKEPEVLKKLTNAYVRLNISGRNDLDDTELTVSAVVNGEAQTFYHHTSQSWISEKICGILPVGTECIRVKWVFIDKYYDEYPDDRLILAKFFIKESSTFCQSISRASQKPPVAILPQKWYDIDGDGLKEYVEEGSLYRLVGKSLQPIRINSEFGNVLGWFNYGKDGLGAYMSVSKDYKTCGGIYGVDGSTTNEIYVWDQPIDGTIDSENSGATDFYSTNHNGLVDNILRIDASGKVKPAYLRVMTPQEYYNLPVKDHYVNPLDMTDMFGRDKNRPSVFGGLTAIDINNDGYLDFINASSGEFLLNTGDGGYVKDTFGGQVIFRDFDGDGLDDMLVYNPTDKSITVRFQRSGGEALEKQLFKGLDCSKRIWCRDFDFDGDIDVLVPFDAEDNSGQAYLVMFENRGDCTFRKRENYIEGTTMFVACSDIDADGNYEVLAETVDPDKSGHYKLAMYRIKGLSVNTAGEVLRDHTRLSGLPISADLNGNGIMRVIMPDTILTPAPEAVNSRPDRPAAPTVVYDAENNRVSISWPRGTDKETATLDLTYELRIGTAPGSDDIVRADALADGTRLNLQPGNCGYNLLRRYNTSGWPKGNIYVSVQTIDDSGRGSEWSEPAVFEKASPTNFFFSSDASACAVDEAMSIILDFTPDHAATYSWDLADGKIISQTDTELTLSFPTSGAKTITLTATEADGSSASSTKTFEVVPARLSNGFKGPEAKFVIDMDCDGKLEILTSSMNFAEGNEKGEYTSIKKLYNTNFSYVPVAVDVNRDGLADMLVNVGNNDRSYINLGEKDMDAVDSKFISPATGSFYDLDNDGFDEAIYGDYVYRNLGGYENFRTYTDYNTYLNLPKNVSQYRDFNRDGLIDYLVKEEDGFTVYENQGNMIFKAGLRFTPPQGTSLLRRDYSIGDFDGDGRPDIAFTDYDGMFGVSSYSDYLYILWNDGSHTKIASPDGYKFGVVYNTFDFSNNGCDDMVVSLDNNKFATIFMNPDRSYTLAKYGMGVGKTYLRSDGRTAINTEVVIARTNTAPQPPTGLRHSIDNGMLIIEWEDGSDGETPAAALRYNISVKLKDAKDENSYIISPLNATKDHALLPSGAKMISGTRFPIPLVNIPQSAIEVRVQTIDTQGMTSAFSEVYEITVDSSCAISMAEYTMAYTLTPVTLAIGMTPEDVDFGTDATIDHIDGRIVYVYWTNSGMHTVTAKGTPYEIMVYNLVSAEFDLPQTAYVGDRIICQYLPAETETWYLYEYINGRFRGPYAVNVDGSPLKVKKFDEVENCVEFVFSRGGTFQIEHIVSEFYGSDSFIAEINITRDTHVYDMDYIDIDENTGKHRINWHVANPDEALFTFIYRETSRTGEYERIGDRSMGYYSFIDYDSDPNSYAANYKIELVMTHGRAPMTKVLQPLHLMLNVGLGNVVNLIWEGTGARKVTTYRILRGSDRDNLACIAEVSGSVKSYTDANARSDEKYYAVEVLIEAPEAATAAAGTSRAARSCRSNVVSTDQSGIDDIIVEEHIEVFNIEGHKVYEGKRPADGKLPLAHGIYIVRRADGTIVKEAVR